jgi:hypothetical protein
MRYRAALRTLVLLLFATAPLFLSTAFAQPCNQQSYQTRATSLGVSGSNINSIKIPYCCTGTLGSLVQDTSGTQYVLSNNHVLARTSSTSGQASFGEGTMQPGLADNSCIKNSGDDVANLNAWVPLSFTRGTTNTVDAATAAVISGDVNTSGSILNVGTIGGVYTGSPLGLPVQKMGRTTCLTSGTVGAVNVTVSVRYPNQCNAASSGTATFVNQIAINSSTFSAGGDSGSLIVTTGSCPLAVGLLFAGSSTMTIANPIGPVLSRLGASMGTTVSMVTACTASPVSPSTSTSSGSAPTRGVSGRALKLASAVKERHVGELMKLAEVVGVGVGLGAHPGEAVIVVFLNHATAEALAAVPDALESVPVHAEETGEFVAY